MNSLFILYSALAAFGVGVTVIDLFGVFEHAGHDAGHGDDATGDDDASGDDDATGHDDATGDDDAAGHDSPSHAHAGSLVSHRGGSYVASADAGTRLVARTIGVLRTVVYFSLGAGPTGLFAMITDVGPAASLAWSTGAGVFIAALARGLRSFIRKDLDSSIRPEEYIMDEAVVTVTVAPGAMGKVAVRRYGRESELYVRAKDPGSGFPKGAAVRIVDYDDDCYWVEAP